MQLLRVNADEHVLQDIPLAETLRRKYNIPDIFTYWHALHRNWNVAVWIRKDQGLARDLLVVGSTPNEMSRSRLRTLEGRLFGPNLDDLRDAARECDKRNWETLREIQDTWNEGRASLRAAGIQNPGVAKGKFTE